MRVNNSEIVPLSPQKTSREEVELEENQLAQLAESLTSLGFNQIEVDSFNSTFHVDLVDGEPYGNGDINHTLLHLFRPADDEIWIPFTLKINKILTMERGLQRQSPSPKSQVTDTTPNRYYVELYSDSDIIPKFNMTGFYDLEFIEAALTDHLERVKSQLSTIYKHLIAKVGRILEDTIREVRQKLKSLR